MKNIILTHSANAGVVIEIGGHRIWVDALCREKQPGFSALTPEQLARLWEHPAFADPEHIIITHFHGDHYDAQLIREACARWPGVQLHLPGKGMWEKDGLSIRFFPLPHEGEAYAGTPHFGTVISAGGRSVVITGDCQVGAEALETALAGQKIDVAVLDFPWITLGRGRYLLDKLGIPALAICHLPFREDDVRGYRKITEDRAMTLAYRYDIRLLEEPFQREIFA